MIPRKGNDAGFSRDVGQVLRASEVGIRWRDNVGPVLTFRYLATRAPIAVSVPATSAPLGVLVLRAENRDTSEIESDCRVIWRWGRGTIVVNAIDVSNTGDEYDVTLGLLQG